MKKLKTGDKVVVVSGSNKGKEGKITKILDSKVIVEGVNIVKKHLKPKNNGGNGEIIETEAAIHVSNVMLVDPKTKKPTKVKIEKIVKMIIKLEYLKNLTKKLTNKRIGTINKCSEIWKEGEV